MKIKIKNRWNGNIIYACETENLKMAVEMAVKLKINLSGSDLRRSNLRGSNLRGSNLSESDLSRSNLSESDLSGSNLSGSNLDFISIPMCCKSFGVKIDTRIAYQMILHVFGAEIIGEGSEEIKKALEPFAKKSDKWKYFEKYLKER